MAKPLDNLPLSFDLSRRVLGEEGDAGADESSIRNRFKRYLCHEFGP